MVLSFIVSDHTKPPIVLSLFFSIQCLLSLRKILRLPRITPRQQAYSSIGDQCLLIIKTALFLATEFCIRNRGQVKKSLDQGTCQPNQPQWSSRTSPSTQGTMLPSWLTLRRGTASEQSFLPFPRKKTVSAFNNLIKLFVIVEENEIPPN